MLDSIHGHEGDLDVRRRQLSPRLEKGARLGHIGRERTPLEQQVGQDMRQSFRPRQADWLRTGIDHARPQVILEILTDAREVQRDGDSQPLEMGCGANA